MRIRMVGVGLVELMISMLIGSLLMAALLSLFLSQRQLSRQIEATAAVTERMRVVSDFFYRHLTEAGYAPAEIQAPYPVGGIGKGADHPLADTLVIYSEGGRGCTDDLLQNNAGIEWRRFTLFRDSERQELRCEDSEGGPYPVLDGVEAMQVLYGVDTNGDTAPDFYTNVSRLPASASVVSLRVGLLLRGEIIVGTVAGQSLDSLSLLDARLPSDSQRGINRNDGHLRRSVIVTVALRNKVS